jgi:hypothetical protein
MFHVISGVDGINLAILSCQSHDLWTEKVVRQSEGYQF